ncbi:AraC family transcriptional regulator [Gemmatimonas groenlandica]|uniref:Helix-turn-helix transcriptional regulator n=1 Tax=Gemmatimonas groenlandica TaxID=2732249 RepID=A0A6M4IRF8_9BACT|nr:AraC family transcriptional regulator [Gemmatimonas groenlandica]QJR37504.1 helix-turn-helix transcriptional regulator [Gemmatimonas groenlandica]
MPTGDRRIEVCELTHSGPLPPGWLAPGFVMNLVLDGEADLRARGSAQHVHPGVVVLSDPGEFRRVTRRHSAVARTRSLTCDPAVLTDAIAQRARVRATPHLRSSTSGAPVLRHALRALFAGIDAGDPPLALETAIECCFSALASDLNLSWTAMPADRPAIRRVRDLIEDRSGDALSLADLTAVSGLSRAHLIRSFARELGVTPHQYQMHVRVRRARELLAAGRSPVHTAAAVGFFDQSHLTRQFRRITGVGPAAYRRMVYSGTQPR